MKLSLEQFEEQWAENRLSVTDWFDTTYGLFKELEALQSRSCEGCKYGKFGADSRGIEVECTLIWHCARGNGFPDRYEPKEQ